jgi:hypothetical protein
MLGKSKCGALLSAQGEHEFEATCRHICFNTGVVIFSPTSVAHSSAEYRAVAMECKVQTSAGCLELMHGVSIFNPV